VTLRRINSHFYTVNMTVSAVNGRASDLSWATINVVKQVSCRENSFNVSIGCCLHQSWLRQAKNKMEYCRLLTMSRSAWLIALSLYSLKAATSEVLWKPKRKEQQHDRQVLRY
jgi:hypothetical protein